MVWMARKAAKGMSEPDLKFGLYKPKKELRLKLHRRHSGTSLKTTPWDFPNLIPNLLGISFDLSLQVPVHFYSLKGKHMSWNPSLESHSDTLQCFPGLGCEPLNPLKVWYSDIFWGSLCEWLVWRWCCTGLESEVGRVWLTLIYQQ